MLAQQQLDNSSSGIPDPFCIGPDHHLVAYRGTAGSCQCGSTLNFDHTGSASTLRDRSLQETERRYRKTCFASCCEYRYTVSCLYFNPVYRNVTHHMPPVSQHLFPSVSRNHSGGKRWACRCAVGSVHGSSTSSKFALLRSIGIEDIGSRCAMEGSASGSNEVLITFSYRQKA